MGPPVTAGLAWRLRPFYCFTLGRLVVAIATLTDTVLHAHYGNRNFLMFFEQHALPPLPFTASGPGQAPGNLSYFFSTRFMPHLGHLSGLSPW